MPKVAKRQKVNTEIEELEEILKEKKRLAKELAAQEERERNLEAGAAFLNSDDLDEETKLKILANSLPKRSRSLFPEVEAYIETQSQPAQPASTLSESSNQNTDAVASDVEEASFNEDAASASA